MAFSSTKAFINYKPAFKHRFRRKLLASSSAPLAAAYKKNRQFREACLHLEKHTQLGKEVFNQESDLRLQRLRVQHKVKETEREKEIYRLKNVELAQAIEALHTLTASLQAANDDKSVTVRAARAPVA